VEVNVPLPEGEGIGWLKISKQKSPHSLSPWERVVKNKLSKRKNPGEGC